jgi:integrase
VEHHVVPYLGSIAVQALQPKHIMAWHAQLRKVGKSTHAIRLAHQRLQQALDQAALLGVVPRNAATLVKPPQLEHRPQRPTWSGEQARTFLKVAREHGSYGPIFRLVLATGMRRGEVLGLRWADVDWTSKIVHIRQSIGPVDYAMTPGTPKTPRSEHTIPVTDAILEVLREHRRLQNERQLALGPAWHDLDLVFSSDVGTAIQPSNLRRDYLRLVELAGVPYITIHDQRHTMASWAVAAGVDPKTAAERLGQHVSMTLGRYTHTSEKQHRDAAKALDNMITEDKSSGEGKDAL